MDITELWREVRPTVVAPIRSIPPKPDARLFAEHQWTRTRGVALIHTETETILGYFGEYLHRRVANCRRLLRESDSPVSPVEGLVWVSGGWWLGEGRVPVPRAPEHEQRRAVLRVELSEEGLGYHTPAIEVVAFLAWGGIERVELAADTQFIRDGDQLELLELPACLNILPVMSRESKIALKERIGL